MPEQSRSAQIELLADALRGRSRRRPEPVCTLGQLLAANLEIYAKKPDALLRGFIKRALIHDLGGAAKWREISKARSVIVVRKAA